MFYFLSVGTQTANTQADVNVYYIYYLRIIQKKIESILRFVIPDNSNGSIKATTSPITVRIQWSSAYSPAYSKSEKSFFLFQTAIRFT